MLRFTHILSVTVIGLLGAQNSAFAVEPDVPQTLIERMDAVGIRIDKALTAKFRSETKLKKKDHGSLVEFYSERKHKPLWVDEKGLTAKAKLLISEIQNADKYALDPKRYDLPYADGFSSYTGLPAEWLSKAELKLSYAALAYARHARGGQIDGNRLSKYIDVKPELPDPVKVMKDLAATNVPGKFLVGFHPKHEQFKLLLAALKKQRGKKVEVHIELEEGPAIRLGDESEQVPLLRERLKVDIPKASEDGEGVNLFVFDLELEEAIKAYQEAKGLKPDGVVGNLTRRALNRKAGDRVKILTANIERWRWKPRTLGDFHIRANIPEFKMFVASGKSIIHSERVITGKLTNQTPIFSDQMETVVLNPYWYPPRSIVRNEILPGARRNEDFISRHRFQVTSARGESIDPYDVDWYNVRPKDFSFRQPPGPGNVLGELKFLFPNKHAVYMHDTPTKPLFNKQVRAFSHGCVRVRNPRRLAEIILSNEKWSKSRVSQQINAGENQHVRLRNKIPVHIMYFTAWANPETGDVQYFDDIYRHDAKVIAKLEGRPVPGDPKDPIAARVRAEEERIRSEGYEDGDRGFFRGFRRRNRGGDDFPFDPFDF